MTDSKQQTAAQTQKSSDLSVKENENVAKAEVWRLPKQFQPAVEKRKSYKGSIRQQMQAQERKIKSLAQEHKEAQQMLSQIVSLRSTMPDDRNCEVQQCLLQTKDRCNSLIRDRKALLADLDKEILELEKKIAWQYRRAVKVKQVRNSKRLQKQMEMLELDLYNATVHFNTILTWNNNLWEEIESLQAQKAMLDESYLKLHTNVHQQRRRMSTAVEQAEQDYEQWTELLEEFSVEYERSSKDTVQHEVEMQKWEQVLDQEAKPKTFKLTKLTDRSELEEEAKKLSISPSAQRPKRSHGESFERQEAAYKHLQELAKNGDVDQLVRDYIDKEEENFASLRNIIEQSNQLEKMRWKMKVLQ
ncbi:PREDICTED: coiled-coil domain-containing protein 63, partial [Mesitornis unicolor]|uniref:coiled-coil domain-containing protein 63 n=1 Tax=Mesitornis unicolor TaxID=54374 RepID=UPI000528C6BE